MIEEVKVKIETKNGIETFYHAKNKEQRLSISFLKQCFEKDGRKYTEEEVQLISDYFYLMAAIEIELNKQNKILHYQNQIATNEKSYSLHPGEYRRTG